MNVREIWILKAFPQTWLSIIREYQSFKIFKNPSKLKRAFYTDHPQAVFLHCSDASQNTPWIQEIDPFLPIMVWSDHKPCTIPDHWAYWDASTTPELVDQDLLLALEKAQCQKNRERLKLFKNPSLYFQTWLGHYPSILKTLDLAFQWAFRDHPIFFLGEPGAGKCSVAQAILKFSARREQTLLKLNTLQEHPSQLLPWMQTRLKPRQSFVLLIDDFAQISPKIQSEILTLLFNPPHQWDLRIIGCSQVSFKTFAHILDPKLFEIFKKYIIHIPSLRENIYDIPRLAEFFLQQYQKSGPVTLHHTVWNTLFHHHWPRNVQELYDAIQYAIAKQNQGIIKAEHLPNNLSPNAHQSTETHLQTQPQSFDDLQRIAIQNLIFAYYGNLKRCAHKLKISRSTLYRKIDQFNLWDDLEHARKLKPK